MVEKENEIEKELTEATNEEERRDGDGVDEREKDEQGAGEWGNDKLEKMNDGKPRQEDEPAGEIEDEKEESAKNDEVETGNDVVMEASEDSDAAKDTANEDATTKKEEEINEGAEDADENDTVEAEVIIEAKTVEKPEEKKPHGSKSALVMASIAVALGMAGAILGGLAYFQSSRPVTYHSYGTDGNSANFTEGSIASVADTVSKGVVSIVTQMRTADGFGQTYASGAAGTGMIVTADGYIITNKHVVSGATTVTVVADDGTTFKNVKVVATDPLNDVAYLKIDGASNLPTVKLGNSNTVSVGEQVIAIGNALGEYQNTVTAGIISGTGRTLTATDESGSMSENLSGMIQTDAAINGGNSGGPLVNAAGEVIGINTAYSSSAENMGFAIPISSTKGMLEQLVATGSAERAYVGVYNTQITPEIAKEYNLPVSTGVYLYSSSAYSAIVEGSPAAKAGLKDKDIITKVNGIEVGPAGTLSNIVGEYKPGDTVDLTVIRDKQEISVKVTLEGYKEK